MIFWAYPLHARCGSTLMVIRRFHGRHAPALSVIKSENHCLLTTSDGFRWSDCMDTLCYAATRRSEFCFSSASRGLVGRGPGELFWNNLPSPTQLATAKPKKRKRARCWTWRRCNMGDPLALVGGPRVLRWIKGWLQVKCCFFPLAPKIVLGRKIVISRFRNSQYLANPIREIFVLQDLWMGGCIFSCRQNWSAGKYSRG